MRRKPKCPCIGCTPETGRSPDCHGDACKRGWPDYQKEYQEYREEMIKEKKAEAVTRGFIIESRRKRH